MRYYLENDRLKVEIDSFGAEVKSVMNKADSREYMWYGNPKFWGRTSPVLFPFVGSLKNKQYTWKDRTYPMGQHGFARDNEHKLVSRSDDSLEFSFESNPSTLEKYPFEFELRCGYELKDNELKVIWKVTNTSAAETMYFSIGAHPAFLCPVHGEADKVGYRLYFEGCDEIRYHGNIVSTGMALMDEKIMKLQDHRTVITPDFFDECTYFVEGAQTGRVGLEDPDGRRIVDVDMDTPLFAVWSPEGKHAPFLCIEPWYGRCDADDFDGTLEQRAYTNVLGAGETFEASYTIRYHDLSKEAGCPAEPGAGSKNAVSEENSVQAMKGGLPDDIPERLRRQLDFALEIDKEKNIFRQTSLSEHGRKENDAEHAWHMAIMSYLLREYSNEAIDPAKTMIMCLIHDIVEIDAGDTYAYDTENLKTQKAREDAAKQRIFAILPDDQKAELTAMFDEFEKCETPEARFAKAMDNLQPLLLNNSNGGSDWKEHGMDADRVYVRQSGTKPGSEILYKLTDMLIQENIRRGSLKPHKES